MKSMNMQFGKKFITLIPADNNFILYRFAFSTYFRDIAVKINYNERLSSVDFLIDTTVQTLYIHRSFDKKTLNERE